jgi:heparan-alpha-glucosaminide N-acetyltransferase
MSSSGSARPERGVGRILSIDLLRGLDVLLMLFVNEVAGVTGAPGFLLHKTAADDGMTLTDTVFPAFLFIVGMAIPWALGARLRRGEGKASVFRHVLARTFALLVVGVFMVNAEESAPGGLLPPAMWNVLMTLCVMLVFQARPPAGGSPWPGRLRLAGIVLLVALAFAYRNPAVPGPMQMRPHWWGILGLIGWAYLVAATVYLAAGERPTVHLGAMALLYCLYLADFAGHVAWLAPLRPVVEVGTTLGSHAGVVVAGTVLSLLLRAHRRDGRSPARFIGTALAFAVGLAVAGLLLHSLHGLHRAFEIGKLGATVPWCLLASAGTAAAWALVYGVADVIGWRSWPRVVPMAGENALVAYLLAPLLLSLFEISAAVTGGVNLYGALGGTTFVGLVRSAAFAYLVVRLCGVLRARGLRLQLG